MTEPFKELSEALSDGDMPVTRGFDEQIWVDGYAASAASGRLLLDMRRRQ